MKKPIFPILSLLFLIIQSNYIKAQSSCSAGELIALNVNQDSYCSSDNYSGFQNHVSIEISRANQQTGTIQWSFLPENGNGNWVALPAAWTGNEIIENAAFFTGDNGIYRCIFTENGTTCSDTLLTTITVFPQPNIYVTNDSTTCEGMWFSVHDNNNPSGNGNSNCWQFDGVNCASSASSFLFDKPGCMMANGTLLLIVSNFAGCFDEVHITGLCNSDLADVFTGLTGPDVFCRGVNPTVLSVERHSAIPIPTNWQYQWYRNGKAITGENSQTYIPVRSGVYSCDVTTASGCLKSTNPISITVFPAAKVQTSIPQPAEICQGDSILLQVTSGDGITYEWYRNGISTGYMGLQYYATQQGNYKVLATAINGCTGFSTVMHPYVFKATSSTTGNLNICKGESVLLTASSNGIPLSYQWYKNMQPITGATCSQFLAETKGNYRVVITSTANCPDTSKRIVITSNCREGDLSDIANTAFIVSPNPADDYLQIFFSGDENELQGNGQLLLLNTSGQIILNTKLDIMSGTVAKINLPENMKDGIYLLTLTINGQHYYQKVLITR